MKPAALVTGAAKRVGKTIALHLAAQGFDIALHYHTSEKEAQETAGLIRKSGASCEIFRADLSQHEELEPLIEKAQTRFPVLSALVNSASLFDRGSFMESDRALYERQFQVNLEAPVFLTRAFARAVKKGAVVNLLDTCITRVKHPYFHYLLTKKALADFTRMAAAELGPNIRVNGVAPGFILPPEGMYQEHGESIKDKLPLRRLPTPQDVAEAVHTLLIDSKLTGQILFIDSGESLL